MLGPTEPTPPTAFTEFPKIVRDKKAGTYHVLGVRFNDEVTMEQIEQMDAADILVIWKPGPGVEPLGRWKNI